MIILVFMAWLPYTYGLAVLSGVQIRAFVRTNSISFEVANTFLERNEFPGAFSMGLWRKLSSENERQFLMGFRITGYMALGTGILLLLACLGVIGTEFKNGYDVSAEIIEILLAVLLFPTEYLFFKRYIRKFKVYCADTPLDTNATKR